MNPDRAQEQADIGDDMAERATRPVAVRKPREEIEWTDLRHSVACGFIVAITGQAVR